jgi:hypothetical protein
MMWHKDRAQLTKSGAKCWCLFKFCFANMLSKVGAQGIQCPKLV